MRQICPEINTMYCLKLEVLGFGFMVWYGMDMDLFINLGMLENFWEVLFHESEVSFLEKM